MIDKQSSTLGKFMDHATKDKLIQLYGSARKQDNIMSLPVCPKCESAGLRDKGWTDHKIMKCPKCGYSGKATHVMFSYIKEGLFK